MFLSEPHIIQTKINIPTPSLYEIPRKQLIRLLDNSKSSQLIVVSASSGYGKSTILAQWLRLQNKQECHTAWVCLDKNDNRLNQLIGCIVHVLGNAIDGFGDKPRAMLSSSTSVSMNDVLSAIIDELLKTPRQVFLVIDDFHLLHSDKALNFIRSLIDYATENLHIIISGQSEPDLPLSKIRLAGQLVLITDKELRFDVDECRILLREKHKMTVSDSDIDLLLSQTEGWISGIQVAALSQVPSVDLHSYFSKFYRSNKNLVQLLSSEVLSRLDKELKYFLMKSAVPERFDAELCTKLTGEHNSLNMIEKIRRANLFIIQLGDDGRWFRYHNIFREVLLSLLRQLEPDSIAGLHNESCRYFHQKGFLQYAIEHAVEAGNPELASVLIEEQIYDFIKRGELSQLEDIILTLPKELIDCRPHLLLALCWVYLHAPNTPNARQAIPLLKKVRKIHSRQSKNISASKQNLLLLAELRVLVVGVVSANERSATARNLALRWLDELPEDVDFLRGTLSNILAYCEFVLGNLDEAKIACLEGKLFHARIDSYFGVIYSQMLSALTEMEFGNLFISAKLIQDAVSYTRDCIGAGSYTESLLSIGLAEIHYEWNDLNAAAEYLALHGKTAIERGTAIHLIPAKLLTAKLEFSLGRLKDALKILDDTKVSGVAGTFRRVTVIILHEKVRILLASGMVNEARKAIIQARLPLNADLDALTESNGVVAQWELLSIVRLVIAEEDYQTAMRILCSLSEKLEKKKRLKLWLQCQSLTVSTAWLMGDKACAADVISKILPLLERERFIQTIVGEGAQLESAFREYAKNLKESEGKIGKRSSTQYYLIELLSAFDACAKNNDSSSVDQGNVPVSVKAEAAKDFYLIESLTARELQICKLLAEGLSNKLIGERLCLTTETIKWYLRGIYQKLSVANRTQAAIVIQALNLSSEAKSGRG